MESMMDIMGLALKGDSVERLSSQIHESQSATRKGLQSALPLSMAGLASLFSSEQKASELLGTFRGGNFPHVDVSEIGRIVSDPAATTELTQSSRSLLSRLFGGKLDGVLDSLSGASGVSRSSATTLLGIAAPLVLGAIQKESQARALDARGLSRLLSEEGKKATGLLPSSLTGIFGHSEEAHAHGQRVTYTAKAFETHAYDTPAIAPPAPVPPPLPEVRRAPEVVRVTEVAEPRRASGLWWLLVPLALLALWGTMRMGRHPMERPTRTVVTAPSRAAAPPAPPIAVERPKVEESAEAPADRAHVEAPAAVPPAHAAEPVTARVEPERHVVHFETSSSEPLNRPELYAAVAALTEHPDARARLRGYADPRGDQAMNQALSDSRAAAVKSYLVRHGIAADRIDTAGHGAEDTLITNADSRRVEILIEH